MSQTDLHQLSKKIKNLSGSPNTNCLKTERQRKKQKASSKKFFQLSMRTKEKEFQHGPFLELQLFGRTLSARKNAMKRASEIKRCSLSHDFGFLPLYLWCFAAISAFMNLVAPRRTGYGLITLILGSLTGLCSYISCTTSSISIWMAPKIAASVLLFGNPCRFLLESCSFGSLSCPLLPYSHRFSTQLFQMSSPSF